MCIKYFSPQFLFNGHKIMLQVRTFSHQMYSFLIKLSPSSIRDRDRARAVLRFAVECYRVKDQC